MKSIVALSLLIFFAFTLMMASRRRSKLADRSASSLKAFDESVIRAIRQAGGDSRVVTSATSNIPQDLQFKDLLRIFWNCRGLAHRACHMCETHKTWADGADALEIKKRRRGLLKLNSGLLKKLPMAACEIVFGHVVQHSHYYYTHVVAGAYCAVVDTVEDMADVLGDDSAEELRKHLP